MVCEVKEIQVLDKQIMEEEPMERARQVSYMAHLGEPEEYGQRLWMEAKRRNWKQVGNSWNYLFSSHHTFSGVSGKERRRMPVAW
jgi:hypothetical protein